MFNPASETPRLGKSTAASSIPPKYKRSFVGTAFERAWSQSVFDFSDEAVFTLNDNVEINRHARSNLLLPYAAQAALLYDRRRADSCACHRREHCTLQHRQYRGAESVPLQRSFTTLLRAAEFAEARRAGTDSIFG